MKKILNLMLGKIVTIALLSITVHFTIPNSAFAQSVCNNNSLPDLPDVTITSITQETEYAPHCRVSGVIGKEIKFELLLPENWNGKFVMGGGGGFVGGRYKCCSILCWQPFIIWNQNDS